MRAHVLQHVPFEGLGSIEPWLTARHARAIASGRPVLGICLGAQLIASALGARVPDKTAPRVPSFESYAGQGAATYA